MNTIGIIIGQIVVAILALGIVGWLVFSTGSEPPRTVVSENLEKTTTQPHNLTPLDKKFTITNDKGEIFVYNELNLLQRNKLIAEIETSRLGNKEFLSTSKSLPPPDAKVQYFLENESGKINLSTLAEADWLALKKKMEQLKQVEMIPNTDFIHSSKAPLLENTVPEKILNNSTNSEKKEDNLKK